MIETKETSETIPRFSELSVAELDGKLEEAAADNERSEKLICFYLFEMRNRRGHESFGFGSIYDYAAERFGFSERKTRYLLYLGFRLQQLPRLSAALAEGRIGWTKACKVAAVATAQDEAMWLESGLSLSVRELDRRIRDGAAGSWVKFRIGLSEDQAAVWQSALEVCRRLAGEELDAGRCLELIAGEFLATYAYLAHQREESHSEEAREDAKLEKPAVESEPDSAASEESPEKLSQVSKAEEFLCPENGDLPSPVAVPYSRRWREVLERDRYCCQYPGCSARAALQVHHIEYRSGCGRKGRAASNAASNLLVLCVFHHRQVHAAVIGVQGRAPSELAWRRPELMERVMSRRGRPADELEIEVEIKPEKGHFPAKAHDQQEPRPAVVQ